MSASCPHLDQIGRLPAPKLSHAVHREECTQCFDNQDGPDGVDVCLSCFNGGCSAQGHARNHVQKSGHRWTLNIRRTAKPKITRGDEEPPAKITKLAIVEERDEDKYDYHTTIKCYECNPSGKLVPEARNDPKIKSLIDGIMQSMSSARQSEVQSWEEEINPCEHALLVHQSPKDSINLTQCSSPDCGLKQNLWLCLTCGNLGCGRSQYGGVGGNSHALAHYEATKHPVTVKLGTITPEGQADLYCYLCNDATLDPNLAEHLATFRINVMTQTKTEKSMTELQIEHNLKYDFSLTTEDGKALEPVFGPGLTGLANLGNSCYMASVLQTLFFLPSFHNRYFSNNYPQTHFDTCTEKLPAECLECQMCKIADGLLGGRYSKPASAAPSHGAAPTPLPAETGGVPVFQAGIRPSTFKSLVGKGHVEFSTMKQQDAEEFLGWLITSLRREGRKRGGDANDATKTLSYSTEQRIQCLECKRVSYKVDGPVEVLGVGIDAIPLPSDENAMDVDKKEGKDKVSYKPVELANAISSQILGSEILEAYQCEDCRKRVDASKQTKFASFPETLVIHLKKFQLVNWVPTKLDVPILLPQHDTLEFTEKHLGKGIQSDEVAMSQNASTSSSQPQTPQPPAFNAAALSSLESMGFPFVRCQKALLATGNTDNAEIAMEWLFAHMDDPDIDEPLKESDYPGATASVSSVPADGTNPSKEQIAMLAEMGFTHAQARKALVETGNNAERAVEWLFNHPDDPGMEEGASASSAPPPSQPQGLIGSTDVPVKYRLKAFISHKGPSVHSGHYVAHIRVRQDVDDVDEGWVLFNDEKVVKADRESVKELKKLAYLYVFEKA